MAVLTVDVTSEDIHYPLKILRSLLPRPFPPSSHITFAQPLITSPLNVLNYLINL